MTKKLVCSRNLGPAAFSTLGWKMIKPNADGTIYWHVVNFTNDQEKYKTLYAFTKGIEKWQAAFDRITPVGRYITFKPTSDFHKAHIRFYFMQPGVKHQQYTISDGSVHTLVNNWPFDGPQGVLAHVVPNSNDIYFDEGEQWSDVHKYQNGKLWVNLMAVFMHEFGHALGFGHSQFAKALMGDAYDGSKLELDIDEHNGLQHLWGAIKAATFKKIKSTTPKPPKPKTAATVSLVDTAMPFYGVKEVRGEASNNTILGWIREVFPGAVDDSRVAWCSIFINKVAQLAGLEHTNSAMAKSWLTVGEVIEWKDRQYGDVVVLNRTRNPKYGHVGIYLNDREGERIRLLGGNQQNAINIRSYPVSRVAGVRRLSKIEQ